MEHPLGQALHRSGPGPVHGSDSIMRRAGQLTLSRTEIPQDSCALLPSLRGQCRISPRSSQPGLEEQTGEFAQFGVYPPSVAPGSSWPTSPSRCRHCTQGAPTAPCTHVPEVPSAAGREAVQAAVQKPAKPHVPCPRLRSQPRAG